MFKKLVVSILLCSFLVVSTPAKSVLASGNTPPTWYAQDLNSWLSKVNDPDNPEEIFAERYTSAQVEWVMWGLINFVINHLWSPIREYLTCVLDTQNPLNCDGPLQSTLDGLQLSVSQPASSDPLADIFSGNRPLSGIGYTKRLVNKMSPVQIASAQGEGYEAAESMRGLWGASRDISYFFLVLALVVLSFMIMFRIKTSPQTIITIQSALPRILVAIILVTFSYAIAGFVIDLMYVATGLIAGILVSSGLFGSPVPNSTVDWGIMYAWLSGSFGPLGVVLQIFNAWGLMLLMAFYFVWFGIIGFSTFFSGLQAIITIPLSPFFALNWLLVMVIVGIALFIIYAKIAWMLVKTFVAILFSIAGAPFAILGGAVGGDGFGGWLKNLAANLAIFPATGTMFAFAYLFLAAAAPEIPGILGCTASNFITSAIIPFSPRACSIGNSGWVPPFVPTFGDLDFVYLFVSLSIVSLIPKVGDIIKSAIARKPFAYGSAIGAPLAGAWGIASSPFGFVGETFNVAQKTLAESTYSKLNQVIGKIAGKTR